MKIIFIFISILGIQCFLHESFIEAQETEVSSESLTNSLLDVANLNDDDKSAMLGSLGVPTDSRKINLWNIFSYLLFGGIGFIAFIYGKKNALWKPMVIGIVLNIYPYFTSSTFLIYIIGAVLTAALFFWRD